VGETETEFVLNASQMHHHLYTIFSLGIYSVYSCQMWLVTVEWLYLQFCIQWDPVLNSLPEVWMFFVISLIFSIQLPVQ